MFRFSNWYFLILIPPIIYIFFKKQKKSTLKFSSVELLKSHGFKNNPIYKLGRYLTALSCVLLIMALARPQLSQNIIPASHRGIDIALILDVSGSMLSVDFEPNRLEVARQTMEDFIEKRSYDRISLIVFAGTAYTRVPLTLDHNIVKESLEDVNTESVDRDGTAIGTAISVGLNRLKKSDSPSKVIILVTDGDNNAGTINPDMASSLAKELGIRVYPIGVGTDKTIMPTQVLGQTVYQEYDGGINEDLLKKIADTTDGKYYRVKDTKTLVQVFADIDKLEKTDFDEDNFRQYTEIAYMLIFIALVLLAAGIFLDKYYFIHIP